MNALNKKEIAIAKKIIAAGLFKAAESLSFFMNETITLKDFENEQILSDSPWESSKKEESNIQFLTTKVIGDLKGVCCLIFSEKEADQLRSAALPPEILESPEMMKEMSDDIMLEVDNIISASVITQFSNLLNVKIHGSVPGLKKVNYIEMKEFIANEINNELYLVSFKTSFESSNIVFNPEFVWLFDAAFTDSIKRYAAENI